MGISGSDSALLDARSNIARAGASRANAYSQYNWVLTVNGTDRSSFVNQGSVSVRQILNDQPDTARFNLNPQTTFTPTVGHLITLGLGSNTNLEFGGQIARLSLRYEQGLTSSAFYEVEAIDWARLLDRRLITTTFTSISATDIVLAIMTYTSGFTTAAVEEGLPTIPFFPLTNETVSSALKRLANLIDGAYYVDAYRDLHFFGPNGDTASTAGTNPLSITNTLSTTKAFTYTTDVTQVRTRVYVEGQQTTCPISVPVLDAGSSNSLPLNDAGQLDAGPGLVRMNTQRLAYTNAIGPDLSDGANPPGATVTADAAVGDTTLHITTTAPFSGFIGWAKVGDQILRFHTLIITALDDIPASGFGSIQAPITTGTQVTVLGRLDLDSTQSIAVAIPTGTAVVQVTQLDDAAAQSTAAGIEGGDGIHELVIQDNRLNVDGATDRGNTDLDRFGGELVQVQWVTEDLNARAGRQQSISWGGIANTVLITESEIFSPAKNIRPWRRCVGSSLRQAGLQDVVLRQAS